MCMLQLSKNTCNDEPFIFPYNESVGILLFLSLVSRPDIAYAVNVVSDMSITQVLYMLQLLKESCVIF